MKQIITLLLFFITSANFAQSKITFDNCGTDDLLENKIFSEEFENYYQRQINIKAKNPVAYNIPVVFHIIHIGEPLGTESNVSDSNIYQVLEGMNNHLKNNHKHLNNSNSNIQFVLATKAPNGSCSTGINRINYGTNSTYVQHGTQYTSTDSGVDPANIRALSTWDTNKYYNVWVVNKITSTSSVAAYAYLASSHGKIYDGTVISAQFVNGDVSEILTHEIGHSLNLHHTFQGSIGSNCPAQINGCGADGDCVADTPPHIKNHVTDLLLGAPNSCSGNNDSSFKNNYMTYTQNEYRRVFTPQQIARMQSAINFYRSSLLPSKNSVFTMTQAPNAQFLVNYKSSGAKQYFCVGTSISLKNTSTCFLNTFNDTSLTNYSSKWVVTKNGQTILTSTEPNPNIVLTQTGTYSITLTSTNNIGSNSITKNNIIEIISKNTINYCTPTSINKGYYALAIDNVSINYLNNSTAVGVNNGYTDFSCVHITQASSTAPNKIDITASNYNPTISDNMIMQGFIDFNENGSFEQSETIFNQIVPPSTYSKKYSFTFSAPATIKTEKIYRMRIVSEKALLNNSKINCSSQFNMGDVEDYGLIFIKNLSSDEFEKEKYNIYPNPVSNFLNVTSDNYDHKEIQIYSVSGKLVKSMKSSDSNIQINVSDLSSGNYILNINNVTHHFIKK